MLAIKAFRQQFPLVDQQQDALIYFDNAATTQKPYAVINSMVEYYSARNANVH